MKTARTVLVAAIVASLMAGCAQYPPPAPARQPTTGLMDIAQRPAEKALLTGLQLYEDGQYTESEKQLRQALQTGLASPKDRAAAHKYLAFILCTSKRLVECESAFYSARQADPHFTLSKSEAGHPVWGPIYQRMRP